MLRGVSVDRLQGVAQGTTERALRVARRRRTAGLGAAILAAVCCATPVLVLLLGAVGAGGLIAGIDYVVFPALALALLFAWRAHRRVKACERGHAVGVLRRRPR